MFDLNNFQNSKDHENIATLEGSDLDAYKAVAFLHLGKYSEALQFSAKGSYESAYANYKLRNYKKALKIANRNSGEKWDALKSQILYGLGYFKKAYELLNKLPKDDEIVINLQAMKSMRTLTNKVNKSFSHKLYIKDKENGSNIEDNLDGYKFTDESSYFEFLLNKTFECADKKSEYIDTLKKLSDQHPKSTIFKTQLSNVEGYFDEIDTENLTKTQKNILSYNMKECDHIENGLHYLNNYQPGLSDNQYKWIEHARKNNFKINWNEIPNKTEVLCALRILVGLVSKNINKESINKILKDIKNDELRSEIENLINHGMSLEKK